MLVRDGGPHRPRLPPEQKLPHPGLGLELAQPLRHRLGAGGRARGVEDEIEVTAGIEPGQRCRSLSRGAGSAPARHR